MIIVFIHQLEQLCCDLCFRNNSATEARKASAYQGLELSERSKLMNGMLYYYSKILNSYKPVLSLQQNIQILNLFWYKLLVFMKYALPMNLI